MRGAAAHHSGRALCTPVDHVQHAARTAHTGRATTHAAQLLQRAPLIQREEREGVQQLGEVGAGVLPGVGLFHIHMLRAMREGERGGRGRESERERESVCV